MNKILKSVIFSEKKLYKFVFVLVSKRGQELRSSINLPMNTFAYVYSIVTISYIP